MTDSDVARTPWPRDQLHTWVSERAAVLQAAYRADAPWAVRRLAGLRNAVSSGDGFGPAVWEELAWLPPSLLDGNHTDQPSPGERAAQTAMTLFAVHQQSHRQQPMHVSGRRLGLALRSLNPDPEPDQADVRRFTALGTATTFEGSIRHLRGLVAQLRGAAIGLDYGQLAADLYDLQHPNRRDGVRLRWSRDFYTRPPQATAETTTEQGDDR